MLHLITYDLSDPGQNYNALRNAITEHPFVKITESCWIIRSNLTAPQIRDILRPCLDTNDRLFVCDFHHYAAMGLPNWCALWLNN